MTDEHLIWVKYELLVDDLDDSGEDTVCSAMAFLRVNVFPSEPTFAAWSEAERMRISIDALRTLGHDGLVEFWEPLAIAGKTYWTAPEKRQWIQDHLLSMSDVADRLDRLTPTWWTGERVQDFDFGRTEAGEELFLKWLHEPPNDAATRIGAEPFASLSLPPDPSKRSV